MNDEQRNPNNIIILHPDTEKLKDDVAKLRIELSMLLLERDNLLYQECKNIEMAYILSIGGLEYKAYEIECAVLRLKRKIELIQARKNRQEKVVLSEIDSILDEEFAAYQEKLAAQIDKMNAALTRSKGDVLSDEESRELKRLYRSIVKALHPDLHPDLSSEKMQLFYHAVEAYERGDLDALLAIGAMVSDPTLPNEPTEGLIGLRKEKERLLRLVQDVNNRITEIKSDYPYCVKSLIQNPAQIAQRKAELESEIKQLQEILAAYEVRLEEILR